MSEQENAQQEQQVEVTKVEWEKDLDALTKQASDELKRLQGEFETINDSETTGAKKQEELKRIWKELLTVEETIAELGKKADIDSNPDLKTMTQQVENLKKSIETASSKIEVTQTEKGVEVVSWSTPEAKEFIKDLSNIKEVKYEWTPDFATIGSHTMTLIVTYNDGTQATINVEYNVVEKLWFWQRAKNWWHDLWNKEDWKEKKTGKTIAKVGIFGLLFWWGILWFRKLRANKKEKNADAADKEATELEWKAKKAREKADKLKQEAAEAGGTSDAPEGKKKRRRIFGWILWAFGLYYAGHGATTGSFRLRDIFKSKKKIEEERAKQEQQGGTSQKWDGTIEVEPATKEE